MAGSWFLRLLVLAAAAIAGAPAALAVADSGSDSGSSTTTTNTASQGDQHRTTPTQSTTSPSDHAGEPVNSNRGNDDPTELPPAAAPVVGSRVAVELGDGNVLVKLPLASRFLRLSGDSAVPTGSTIDSRHGTVTVTTAQDDHGHVQQGRFWGGVFKVRQSRTGGGMTDVLLLGLPGDCPAPGSRPHARASKASRPPHLWASDRHGRFRTHGRNSVATVRGTRWLTVERCGGTLTYVAQGGVSVNDPRSHRTVILTAGHAYLAHAPR